MVVCRNCRFLNDVNREVAFDRGWCSTWCKWQKCQAPTCKYFEAKPISPRENNNRFQQRYKPRKPTR